MCAERAVSCDIHVFAGNDIDSWLGNGRPWSFGAVGGGVARLSDSWSRGFPIQIRDGGQDRFQSHEEGTQGGGAEAKVFQTAAHVRPLARVTTLCRAEIDSTWVRVADGALTGRRWLSKMSELFAVDDLESMMHDLGGREKVAAQLGEK